MIQTKVQVAGMMCNMCEAHVNDAVRAAFPAAEKVNSSHKKGETVIVSLDPLDEDVLKKAIEDTGYEVTGISTEPYEKKGFSLFGKKG